MCQNKQYYFVSSVDRLPSLYPEEETTDVLKNVFNKGLLIFNLKYFGLKQRPFIQIHPYPWSLVKLITKIIKTSSQ